MKKTLLVFIFFIVGFCARSQYVTLPDADFVTWLKTNGYSSCFNGNLFDTTCQAALNATYIEDNGSVYINTWSINGIHYFKNLDTLKLSNMYADSITDLPLHLKYLYLNGTLTEHISYFPDSMVYISINVGINGLPVLPPLPSTLTYLACLSKLQSLPTLPASLRTLDVFENQLTSLPALPQKLNHIRCSFNQLTALPALPDSLNYLECSNNTINGLPALPAALTSLFCQVNNISVLPALPPNLSQLAFDNNHVSVLPVTPSTLYYFSCINNQLTTLRNMTLPNMLWYCDCSNNQIDSIPYIAAFSTRTFSQLTCANNRLTYLAPGMKIGGLDCSHNLLNTASASVVRSFNAANNNLNALNLHYYNSDSLVLLDVSNNPNLQCLPQLQIVDSLKFFGTGINCLPNYGSVGVSIPALGSVPLCGPLSTCAVAYNIAGRVYKDNNNNCHIDGGDSMQRNIKLQLWSNGLLQQQTLSGGEGYYSFQSGGYGNFNITIDTTGIPFTVTCPQTNVHFSVISTLTPFDTAADFGIVCKPSIDVVAWSITSNEPFRPGKTVAVYNAAGDIADFYGTHCTYGDSGTVTFSINGPATFVSALYGAQTPTSFTNTTVTWAISDFAAVNFFTDFNVLVKVDSNAPLAKLCFTLQLQSAVTDYNPGNNSLQQCYVVSTSHDPNEKEVYPAGNIDAGVSSWLTYTIRFQNTGNDTAFDVVVLDTLDINLDASTFQLLAYSGKVSTQVLPGNIVRFNFANINLPDSSRNAALSTGYVQYKIRTAASPADGVHINNTASIYFDLNAPIQTNTTTNIVGLNTGIGNLKTNEAQVFLYPNPNTVGSWQCAVSNELVGAKYEIYDEAGRVVFTSTIRNLQSEIHLNVSSGIYYLRITGTGITKKMVKVN